MKPDRAQRLADIGSTTALSAMVEIVEGGRREPMAGGILARQVRAMLARLAGTPADQGVAIEAFCNELQSFVESVPGVRHPFKAAERTRERRRG